VSLFFLGYDGADGDREMPNFVRRKYVERRWLSEEMRAKYGL
jgi:hypothetical protein